MRKKIFLLVVILVVITVGSLFLIKSQIHNPPPQIHADKQRTVEITYGINGFIPTPAFIKTGDTVNFKNLGKANMWPIASNPADYPEFDAKKEYSTGEIYAFTFLKPGLWRYHDQLHPFHTATITVKNP